MNLIVCLDERKGMMFNHRRQSRDRILIDDLLSMVGEACLWCSPYSASLFEGKEKAVWVSDCFLEESSHGEWCFVEDRNCAPHLPKIERLVIYHWNRHYPADFYFDIDWEKEGFRVTKTKEFSGSSHERIVKEIYER